MTCTFGALEGSFFVVLVLVLVLCGICMVLRWCDHICRIWVCLEMGYTPNYSHLVGIMIIWSAKPLGSIGCRATLFSSPNPYCLLLRSRSSVSRSWAQQCCHTREHGKVTQVVVGGWWLLGSWTIIYIYTIAITIIYYDYNFLTINYDYYFLTIINYILHSYITRGTMLNSQSLGPQITQNWRVHSKYWGPHSEISIKQLELRVYFPQS